MEQMGRENTKPPTIDTKKKTKKKVKSGKSAEEWVHGKNPCHLFLLGFGR
jgi:hypothetical protein